MHIFSSIILILGAVIVLVLGLVSVLHDLLERGPHDVPLIEDEGLSLPRRLPGSVPPNRPTGAEGRGAGHGRSGSTQWPGGHESG